VKIYELDINGKTYRVEVESEPGHIFKVKVNEKELTVELKSIHFAKEQSSSETPLVVRQQISAESDIAGIQTIRAPIPGEVKKVLVKTGDIVKEGDILLVIEAMKMENSIVSSVTGTVKDIFVREGEVVKLNQALVSLEVKRG